MFKENRSIFMAAGPEEMPTNIVSAETFKAKQTEKADGDLLKMLGKEALGAISSYPFAQKKAIIRASVLTNPTLLEKFDGDEAALGAMFDEWWEILSTNVNQTEAIITMIDWLMNWETKLAQTAATGGSGLGKTAGSVVKAIHTSSKVVGDTSLRRRADQIGFAPLRWLAKIPATVGDIAMTPNKVAARVADSAIESVDNMVFGGEKVIASEVDPTLFTRKVPTRNDVRVASTILKAILVDIAGPKVKAAAKAKAGELVEGYFAGGEVAEVAAETHEEMAADLEPEVKLDEGPEAQVA